ncbi:hypothetical protein L1D14_07385 [Vibrio tubiashii]|uniref:hypothetical protein n=1 Tax=Vibrio tubiashii TaxID=29498 RepID=UPI001EFC959F|nr:hypothetical protein [Vibrio tubiashii]MCG9576060.1 hypothetical protein [Vibrio tubiashii]
MKSILKGKSDRMFEITELALKFKDGDLTISSEVLSFYVVDKSLKCANALVEFDLTLTTQEANWLSQELQAAKAEREPIVVAEYEWLTLLPQLMKIQERTHDCKSVEEFDVIVEEYKQLLGDRDDKGMLDTMMLLRNSIVEFNRANDSRKQADNPPSSKHTQSRFEA